ALMIFLAELHAWDWPTDGLQVRPLWTRNKWRLYLDLDLPTACLLEAVGVSWVYIWEQLLGHHGTIEERRARLQKLISLNAPDVIIENERRMLERAREMSFLGLPDGHDMWDAEDTHATADGQEFADKSIRQQRWQQLTRM